ncbi:hypothetical protein DS2_09467 [Catenovulum agarivorans DS-2]|uniref:Signal peptide prediction n=1 Tax=Catenovulum agarivorans DS-2 TaxID=1328313 RepID=W7QBI3_9ALTE|nr:hypothetical protein [Catenovulum agarivorans]EWH10164.1 hypothetical protein DS2_09467 [Catenovulum agarivorans DS-2]
MKLEQLSCIYANNKHNAFTDLVYYQGKFYCCFRQASNHVSADGRIIILTSSNATNWQSSCTISQHLADLRDPKLSINSNNQLQLLYYRKRFKPKGGMLRNIANENCISVSTNGKSFSQPQVVGENNWWLWRTTPTRQPHIPSLGVAYNRRANQVKLMMGDTYGRYSVYQQNLFSLAKNGKGYPNESDMLFLADGTAYCVLRRDADSFTAQLGVAKPPYKQWQWFDLGEYLGGPKLQQLPDGRIILAARRFLPWRKKFRLTTWLYELTAQRLGFKLQPILELPSGGDNSYPGICYRQNTLYVSYYSQHQHRAHVPRSDIYMAHINLD